MFRLNDRFDSQHLLASRREAATYIRDNYIVNGELQGVQDYNRAAWELQNFFEELGYLVHIGALRVELAYNSFGQPLQANWALYEAAIYKSRAEANEPDLYEYWEQLNRLLVERSLQKGLKEKFTAQELRRFVELECFVGEEPPTKSLLRRIGAVRKVLVDNFREHLPLRRPVGRR
jgi:hypothetical protein